MPGKSFPYSHEAEARGQILHAKRFGVVAVHVAHHVRHERRNRPVLYAPLEFLQAKTELAPDQVAKQFVIMISMVKCEENLLRKPQRLAYDRPLKRAHQHLILQRMRSARHKLVTTGAPIKSIATDVGYANTENFCRAFKKHCGLTAAAYRRKFIPFG